MSDPLAVGEAVLPARPSTARRAVALSGAFLVSGVSSYVLMAVAKREMTAPSFSVFAVFWSLGFFVTATVGPPIEQELSRAVASRRAVGEVCGPEVRAALGAAGLAAALGAGSVLAIVASGALPELRADPWLAGSLVALVFGEAGAAVVRGYLAGSAATSRLGGVVVGQSVVRAAVVAVLTIRSGRPSAMALAVALSAVTCLAFVPWSSRGRLQRCSTPPSFSRPGVLRLAIAAPCSAVFSVGTPALASLVAADSERAHLGDILAALSFTSAPVFAAAALQSALLPTLVRNLTLGDHESVARTTRLTVAIVTALAVVAALVVLVIGRPVLEAMFGPVPTVGALPLAAMTFGAGMLFLAALLAPVCIARGRHASVAKAWALGAGALTISMVVVREALGGRVAVAVVAGSTVVVASMVASLRAAWARPTA